MYMLMLMWHKYLILFDKLESTERSNVYRETFGSFPLFA